MFLLTQDEYNFIAESNRIENEPGVDFDHIHAFMLVKKWATEGVVLTEKHILELHTSLMCNKLRKFIGEYRRTDVGIHKGGELIKLMPNPAAVPLMMDGLLQDFNNVDLNQLNGHGTHSINPWELHKAFENIHPFIDGNGRVGRLLWAFDMLRRGGHKVYPMLQFYWSSDVDGIPYTFEQRQQRYYEAL